MPARLTRRSALQAAAAAGFTPTIAPTAAGKRQWPIEEGPDTPKLCLNSGDGYMPPPLDQQQEPGRGMSEQAQQISWRRIRQLGVNHIIGIGLGPHPWDEQKIRAIMDRVRKAGLNFSGTLISISPTIVFGRPGRDAEIESLIKSIQAAGRAGLPLVEYNFYAHRLTEGYFAEEGRAGSGHTGFDYDRIVEEGGQKYRVRDLPPRPEVGAWKAEDLWKNLTYLLKAIVPAAEKAGVRLAVHPNDPPPRRSRGSEQILGSVADWKRLISIVDSPANGITFDPGVTRETGEDPVEVCRYFASRDRINHAHYRNVIVMKPFERYKEVALDEGQADMFHVMLELVRHKYNRLIYPEHPRGLDYDRERPGFRPQYPGGGGYASFAFTVAYTRAMMQAALASL